MTQENPHELKFATKFPDWHPKAGKPTHFPWTICRSMLGKGFGFAEMAHALKWYPHPEDDTMKLHTARKGHTFKVGDWIQPITEDGTKICPPLRLTWVRKFFTTINPLLHMRMEAFDGYSTPITGSLTDTIAANDGLSIEDFTAWFSRETFDGQLFGWTADPYTNL